MSENQRNFLGDERLNAAFLPQHSKVQRSKVQRYPRHPLEISVLAYQECSGETWQVTTYDLSLGGLFLCSPLLPEIGDRFRLRLDLPTGAFASLGEVVHVRTKAHSVLQPRPAGFGLAFMDCPPLTQMSLKAHLNEFGQQEGAEWSLLPPPF